MFLKSYQALLPVGVQKVLFTGEKMVVVIKKVLTWASARQECKKLGGDLASPLSDAELDQLAQILTGTNPGKVPWV